MYTKSCCLRVHLYPLLSPTHRLETKRSFLLMAGSRMRKDYRYISICLQHVSIKHGIGPALINTVCALKHAIVNTYNWLCHLFDIFQVLTRMRTFGKWSYYLRLPPYHYNFKYDILVRGIYTYTEMTTNGITYTTAAYILPSRWQLMASRTRPRLIYLHQDGN